MLKLCIPIFKQQDLSNIFRSLKNIHPLHVYGIQARLSFRARLGAKPARLREDIDQIQQAQGVKRVAMGY